MMLNLKNYIHCSSDLFRGQKLAIQNIFIGVELFTDASAEQVAEYDQDQVSMDASPLAAFKVVQAELFLCFAETILYRPATKGHPKYLPQVPTVSTGNSIR